MTRRSVTNERYRGEMKGTTRRSAASAKPKRDAGVATSTASPASKKAAGKAAKPGLFGRRGPRQPAQAAPSSPEMKRLRRWWWAFMGTAVIIALAMVPSSGLKNPALDSALFAFYAVALGGALYLEFGPLRRARQAAVAATKKSGKSGSGKGGAKSSSSGGTSAGGKVVTSAEIQAPEQSAASRRFGAVKDALGFGSKPSGADKGDTGA